MAEQGTTLGAVTLVTGPAEFLSERAVTRALQQVDCAFPSAESTVVLAESLTVGALAELTSPSLFATATAVVVRGLENLPDSVQPALLELATSPSPHSAMVLVHGGGQKGKGLLDKLRKLPAVHEVRTEAPKPWKLPGFVTAEVRHHGGSIADEAAAFLIDAVGTDLRALSGAAEQLVSDFAPQRLTVELVRRYFDGRAEVKGFDIADAAIAGRCTEALQQLRWAMGNSVAPVLITSAFASGLRSLGRLAFAPRNLSEADLARHVGTPPFRLKPLRTLLRGWTPEGLRTAIQAVARADLEVKGGAGDPEHAMERMVLAVTAAYGR
jgi:DNA polymerase-3 subunit delta